MRLFRTVAGIALIVIGFFALITPFTPGSWLAFVGFELLGIRFAAWDRIRRYWQDRSSKRHGQR